MSAAHELAGHGWRVFPVNGRKMPLTPNGLHDATTDLEQIDRWRAELNPAGVAIRTGDGLVVLDVDGDAGADALHELERTHGELPETVRAVTGGGGAHYYFRSDQPVPCSAGKVGPGLDVRGEGGYVVAPPSAHPSGNRYEWDIAPSEADPAPLPEWLRGLATARLNGTAPPLPDSIPPGERNATLASLAGSMRRRGATAEAMLAALRAENTARCVPPLDDDELVRIAESVGRYQPASPPTAAVVPDIAEVAEMNGHVAAALPASVLIGFTEIIAKPVRWAWQDRVALAKITALAGRPKIGKGLLYSDVIARVTRGELSGDLEGPRDVILVTTEDDPGDTLKPRLMAAGADLARVSIFTMGSRDEPVPFRVPQDASELGRRVGEKDAALVVIDPLMEFIDGKVDSHKSHPVRQALAALNQIGREAGCAILTVIHLNKGASTDPLVRHEGSAAFTQVVRGGLMLGQDPDDPDGEEGNQRVLAVSSSNLAAIAPSLVYRIETRHVDGDTGEEITTAGMVHIGESSASGHDLLRGHASDEERSEREDAKEFLLAELAAGPRPAKELKDAARDAGIAERTLRRARTDIGVHAERVGTEGRGGGYWQWSLRGPTPPGHLNRKEGGHLNATPLPERDSGGSESLRGPLHNGGHLNSETPPAGAPRCSCFRPADVMADGRCGRCYGTVPPEWRGAA